jgi:hypothetical protein
MSRLDDELKVAFRRVEPSADFADRVIGLINNRPAQRPGLWQRLKSFLAPPVARWVAVGVATSLLVAIFAAQYERLRVVTPEGETAPINAARAPEDVKTKPLAPPLAPAPPREKERAQAVKHQPLRKRAAFGRDILARQRKVRRHSVEAERARDQVLLALQIASSTLNEANKMVRGDD